jgi:hypothetical protein
VSDNEGNSIEGATVSTTGTFFHEQAITDEDGRYSLEVRGYGKHTLRAEKDGYWTQKRNVTITAPGVTYAHFHFTLAENQEVFVITAGIYSSVESNETSTNMSIDFPSFPDQEKITVHDFAGKGSDFYFTMENEGSLGSKHRSHSFKTKILISGEYWDLPGKVDNCYAVEITGTYIGFPVDEFINHSDAEGNIISIEPGSAYVATNLLSGSSTFPSQISPSISVNVLGVLFNHTFTVEIENPDQKGTLLECDIFNEDMVEHHYELFIDEVGFLHVWQLD